MFSSKNSISLGARMSFGSFCLGAEAGVLVTVENKARIFSAILAHPVSSDASAFSAHICVEGEAFFEAKLIETAPFHPFFWVCYAEQAHVTCI